MDRLVAGDGEPSPQTSQAVRAVLSLRCACKRVAPATGFGPATSRLTVGCSGLFELRRDGRYRRTWPWALAKVVGHQGERPRPLSSPGRFRRPLA